jgi:ATP-dependent RNA helicase DeaD
MHLANKIKDVEVDHEIDNYLPAINNVLENLSKEELRKWFRLNSTVLSTIIKLETFQINLQVLKDDDRDGAPRENNNGGATRYFVNIGSRDLIGCH